MAGSLGAAGPAHAGFPVIQLVGERKSLLEKRVHLPSYAVGSPLGDHEDASMSDIDLPCGGPAAPGIVQ